MKPTYLGISFHLEFIKAISKASQNISICSLLRIKFVKNSSKIYQPEFPPRPQAISQKDLKLSFQPSTRFLPVPVPWFSSPV